MTIQINNDNLPQLVADLGAKKSGSGYLTCCPAHLDTTPSLSLAMGQNGKVVMRCHRGCTYEEIVAAIQARSGLLPPTPSFQLKPPSRFVRAYEYTDETGHVLYRVARFEPKDFRPQHLNAEGKWINGFGGIRRVLYNLPEVIANDTIFVVEGEKDTETLRSHGFVATTNAGGANGWRDEFNAFFRDKRVYLIPDNDDPGLKRVVQIARGLLPLAQSINILQLSGAKDVTGWFEQGHSEAEFVALMESDGHDIH